MPVRVVEAMPAHERAVLRTSGEGLEWHASQPVRDELRRLLHYVGVDEREVVEQAIQLAEYGCETETGMAVAPPAATESS